MAKTIIFCADGTWNSPTQDEDGDVQPDPSNVYKLFLALDGSLAMETREADEQEKTLLEGGQPLQVAKYIHGVGDSRNPIVKLMGGAFGAGIISRIVRGYTFVSRHYQPGDRIILAGFSRGAYTARALGGLISSQGLLKRELTADKSEAYRWGAKAWYRYRLQSKATSILARLHAVADDLPAFLSSALIQDSDLVPGVGITAIAVWDTVGALGIPRYVNDQRIDAFKFADTALSPKVTHGFHAVALDERRVDFAPTLWQQRAGISQLLFPGAHADVGGGYPTAQGESELADIALQWLAEQLRTCQVRLDLTAIIPFHPSPCGTAHEPWQHPPFKGLGKTASRDFGAKVVSASGIGEHPAIAARQQCGPVRRDPGATPAPYAPTNRP